MTSDRIVFVFRIKTVSEEFNKAWQSCESAESSSQRVESCVSWWVRNC